MYQNILLCYDGTVEGRRALRQGADVAMAMRSKAYLLAICRNMVAIAVPEAHTPELVTTGASPRSAFGSCIETTASGGEQRGMRSRR